MTTEVDNSVPLNGKPERLSVAGRLASLVHRYLPVWRTVYVLIHQVAGLRADLAHSQHQLAELREQNLQKLAELREQNLQTNLRLDETCLRLDQAHLQILEQWERVDQTSHRIDSLHEGVSHRIDLLQEGMDRASAQIEASQERIDLLQEGLERESAQIREIDSGLEKARLRAGQTDADLVRLDEWYQDLQELHRGAPEKVLEVQKSYLPHFNDHAWLRAAGPIVDLGCGRGEWLSLLNAEGWTVKGVDSSEQAVRESRELGLDVELGDLVDFLEACPDSALAGVTAFQVIEHLPFGRITALMHAAYRALVPGGILLLETPNPENLQVSSYSFWMDPTHKHPIPPPLIMDLSYHVGFRDGSVLRKNPWPQWREQEAETGLESEMAYRLYGPQDYAILVYKPASDAQ